MKKIIISLILIFGIIITVKGQALAPQAVKSPNVTSMERFGDIPVNLFTGTPNISIPLYEINSGNIKVPISLRYHSSSVRPNQPPGWVGLGWDLDCAGAITRQVRGAYDEFEYTSPGIMTVYNNKNYLTLGANNFVNDPNWLIKPHMYEVYYASNLQYGDQQADEFSFNFLGHSGKFYYSGVTNGWVVVSNEKIKVEFNGLLSPSEIISNALFSYNTYEPQWYYSARISDLIVNETKFIKEFTLITSDGSRYTFGGINAVEFTTSYTTPEGQTQATPYKGINLSSWLLKKVVDKDGKILTYNYKRDYPNLSLSHNCNAYSTNISDNSASWQYCLLGNCLDNFGNYTYDFWAIFGGTSVQGSSYSSSSQLINPYRLYGNIVFPMYLENITSENEIVTFNSTPASTLGFNDAQLSGAHHLWDHDGEYELWKNNTKWNKLNILEVKDKFRNNIIKKYTFEYFENSNKRFALSKLNVLGSDMLNYKKYEFQYNDISALPLYGGNYTDHWGFYNGINIRSTLGTAFEDRQTMPDVVTKGLLTEIKYPTGGTTLFTWEAHKHSRVLSDTKNGLNTYVGFAGGSRIKEIKSYTDAGLLASQKKYYYVTGYNSTLDPNSLSSSGVLNGIPKYTFRFENYTGEFNGMTNFSFQIFSLNSYTNNNPAGNGSHIGYDEVVEVNLDNSYTKHFFTNFGPDLDGIPHYDQEPLASTGWKLWDQSVYMNYTSLEEERGKEIATYDYNLNNILVQKTKTVFRNDVGRFSNYVKQKIISEDYGSPTSGDVLMFSVIIKNLTYTYFPISQEQTIYDINGLNPITSTKNFSYNSNNQIAIEQRTTSNQSNIYQTKYYYPCDTQVSTEPNESSLCTKNIINTPLKTENFYNTELLSSQITKFDVFPSPDPLNSLYLPKYIWTKKGNVVPDQLEKEMTYNYDDNGNIIEYTLENGLTTYIIWGYNKTQPIAKIENNANIVIPISTISNLQSLSNADNDHCTTIPCTGNEEALRVALNNLRTSYPNGMITTYTYDPLIGVTSITDAKGDRMTFEYDALNRLKWVKDKNGNILSQNQYHYKN